MPNASYVYSQSRPQALSGVAIDTAKTFTVNCQGFNILVLDVAFTRVAGTALVFTLAGDSVQDSSNYTLCNTTFSGGTGTAGTVTVTYTTSTTGKYKIPVKLDALGIGNTGNVVVSVIGTGAGGTDLVSITPYVAISNG
jgi:hypothetical protein